MVRTLPFTLIGGDVSKEGDQITLLEISFISMSSSKVSTICLLLKLTVESPGSALRSNGGRESLGPPAGGMILAQPVGTDVQNAATRIKINAVKKQVFFMRDKLTAFVDCQL